LSCCLLEIFRKVKIKNFTPCLDTIVEKYGLMTAAVYGRVWRYSQGKQGYCSASQTSIADWLRVDRSTVNRHIQLLVKNKYLKDLTPEVRNRPHKYRPTKKAGLELSAVAFDNTGVALNNSAVALDDTTVALSNTKKEVKKEIKSKDSFNGDSPHRKKSTPKKIKIPKADIEKLYAHFSAETKIKTPDFENMSDSGARSFGASWVAPLRDMWIIAGQDIDLTMATISAIVWKVDFDITSPRSLLNSFPRFLPASGKSREQEFADKKADAQERVKKAKAKRGERK